jgi:hypothetical protein
MESFGTIKRRATDLLNQIPSNLPSIPAIPAMPTMPAISKPKFGSHALKGTWERISLPPLPRSSHSLNVVDGKAYIFGGEISPRQPVDTDMHVVVLPFSGAPADCYAVRAVAARANLPVEQDIPSIVVPDEEAPETDELADTTHDVKGKKKDNAAEGLDDVPLTSPPGGEDSTAPLDEVMKDLEAVMKDKGKGPAAPSPPDTTLPPARVGHATAVIGSRIFLFGGRAGASPDPLDEGGRVWVFDTKTHTWSFLDPAPPPAPPALAPEAAAAAAAAAPSPVPAPRSFHAAVAVDRPKPREGGFAPPRRAQSWQEWAEGDSARVGTPQAPIVGNIAAVARDEDEDGYGTLVVHGGCLLGGGRTADVWAFDVRSRVWSRLPDAPGPARGGAALAASGAAGGRLYRFGGFSGAEEGGQLDYLELGVDSFDDRSSVREEVTLVARGEWQSLSADPARTGYGAGADGGADVEAPLKGTAEWPGPRSVASLQTVTTGGGWEYLVLCLGERTPSAEGHEGAGQFWDDVWAFRVPPRHGVTAASVTDAVFGVLGRKTGEGQWVPVEMSPFDDEDDAAAEGPGPRGWIASAPMGDLEDTGIVIWGGLDGRNKRLGDGWILRLGSAVRGSD